MESTQNDFKAYPSIIGLNKIKTDMDQYQELIDQIPEFVVTEKIHGCNVSFICTPDNIKVCRRNGILTSSEYQTFYKIYIAYTKYQELLKIICTENNFSKIYIYGEWCGGVYQNQETVKSTQNKPIQQEIMYSPTYEFIIFDIFNSETHLWMPYDQLCELCTKYNLFYAPILYRGSYNDCIDWSTQHYELPSTIATNIFHLPELENQNNNLREGHVIRPTTDNIYSKFNERFIIKHKNTKFLEQTTQTVSSNIHNTIHLPEEITNCICETRLINILLKLTPEEKTNIRFVINAVKSDILSELQRENQEFYEIATKFDNKQDKMFKGLISKLINTYKNK